MAEGYSHNPDDESDEIKAPEVLAPRVDSVDRFKHLMGELFKDKKESEDDDEEKEDSPEKVSKGRFGRIWSKLFPSVAQKEDIVDAGPVQPRGMFVDMLRVPEEPTAEVAPVATVEVPELELLAKESKSPADAVEASVLEEAVLPFEASPSEPDMATTEQEQEITTLEVEAAPAPVQEAEQIAVEHTPDVAAEASPVPVEHQYYGYGGLTPSERYRLHKVEERQKADEKELKKIHKQVERDSAKPPKKEAAPISYERLPDNPERTVPPVFRTPEVRREALKQESVKRESIEQKAEHVAEIKRVSGEMPTSLGAIEEFEKAYEAPLQMQKYIEKAETSETKEIAHELSHEHKDMDKQSMATWAALQASASATATANAKALADAQASVMLQPSLAPADDPKSQPAESMYKKAIVSGMVSAVIIISIIIVILLVQSK